MQSSKGAFITSRSGGLALQSIITQLMNDTDLTIPAVVKRRLRRVSTAGNQIGPRIIGTATFCFDTQCSLS